MIKKMTLMVLAMAFILSGLTGCGSQSSATSGSMGTANRQMSSGYSGSGMDNSTQAAPTAPTASSTPTAAQEKSANGASLTSVAQSNPVDGHKIIQTGDISMETLKFDESVSKIEEYVSSIGGYTESSSIQGQGINSDNNATKRTANFVFRVPTDKYANFFIIIKGFGVVTSEQTKGQDITDQYFDTDARLKSLQIQEERELALLQKAVDLSDILELEKELNSVRYQIESYTGTLRKWDSLISYATIRVNIREVDESKSIAPAKTSGLGARITYNFSNSMKQLIIITQNFIVLIVAMLPFLAVLSVLIIAGFFIRRKFKMWQAKRNDDSARMG